MNKNIEMMRKLVEQGDQTILAGLHELTEHG
jgi:hypothetical protein